RDCSRVAAVVDDAPLEMVDEEEVLRPAAHRETGATVLAEEAELRRRLPLERLVDANEVGRALLKVARERHGRRPHDRADHDDVASAILVAYRHLLSRADERRVREGEREEERDEGTHGIVRRGLCWTRRGSSPRSRRSGPCASSRP